MPPPSKTYRCSAQGYTRRSSLSWAIPILYHCFTRYEWVNSSLNKLKLHHSYSVQKIQLFSIQHKNINIKIWRAIKWGKSKQTQLRKVIPFSSTLPCFSTNISSSLPVRSSWRHSLFFHFSRLPVKKSTIHKYFVPPPPLSWAEHSEDPHRHCLHIT